MNKYSKLAGDSLWEHMFGEFADEIESELDLDVGNFGIDEVAKRLIITDLKRQAEGEANYDLYICHANTMDHSVHYYTPSHPEVVKKLEEIDPFL